MSLLEALKQSDAWDSRYNLPLYKFNNPWTYLAYTQLVLKLNKEEISQERILQHYVRCTDYIGFLFKRWPDGREGLASHDEIIGACSLHPVVAKDIFDDLEGVDWETEERLFSRLFWLKPYVRACAEMKVGWISQAFWSLYCACGIFAKEGQVGPHLRRWLMADKMRRYPLCNLAIVFWKWRIERKGICLNDALRVEPGCEALWKAAPREWTWPNENELQLETT